jgi:hypothetical protein
LRSEIGLLQREIEIKDARWIRGVDKGESTVQMPEKTNRYPDFVRYFVQQLKSYCPMLGRFKIAEILCHAGLHLSVFLVRYGCY